MIDNTIEIWNLSQEKRIMKVDCSEKDFCFSHTHYIYSEVDRDCDSENNLFLISEKAIVIAMRNNETNLWIYKGYDPNNCSLIYRKEYGEKITSIISLDDDYFLLVSENEFHTVDKETGNILNTIVFRKKYKYYEEQENKDFIFIVSKRNNIFEVNRNYYYKTYINN